MADSPEGPRLSGLARSIDALFSAAPAAPPSVAPTVAPTVLPTVIPGPSEEEAGSVAPPVVEPEAASEDRRPLAPEIFPASQMLTALSEPAQVWTPVDVPTEEAVAPGSDALLSFDSPWSEPHPDVSGAALMDPWTDMPVAPPEPEPAATDAPVASEITPEPSVPGDVAVPSTASASDDDRSRDRAAATPEPGSDADRFVSAVDAFVGGDRDQRERVETLAVGLRERLALDPLADAVERLVRSAGDPPDRTYIALATTVMNPAVASRLVQRMGRERDEAKRADYITLCRRLGLVMANSLKGALTGALEPSVRRVYYDALLAMGPVSQPVIEAMIEDENRFLVRDACVMLAEIGGARAVQLVTSALADTDPRVRAEVLHALGELGDAEAGSLALGFLEDGDSNVRLAAAVAAGKLGLERALRPLLQLLEQESEAGKRVRLLEALGELGDPGAVPAIEKHALPSRFAKASTDVRVAAYKALHDIGTPHARDLVQRAVNDKEPAVRAALRGLVREA